MESRDSNSPESGEYAAALPLEISHEVASRADDLLREFAEDSGLETALIVDRSGALVAGISAEEEVTVEVISALVAGASGAMRALVSRLGETGAMESLHLGGDRLIYLREIVNRFILVGVSEANRPAGLVRNKARHIEGELAGLLHDIRPAEVPLPGSVGKGLGSVREAALRRAARDIRDSDSDSDSDAEPESAAEPAQKQESAPEAEPPTEPEVEAPLSSAARPPREPRGILEPLDFGEPEIVIEPSVPLPTEQKKVAPPDEGAVDPPFDGEKKTGKADDEEESPPFLPPSVSVFELEVETDDAENDDEPGADDAVAADPAADGIFAEAETETEVDAETEVETDAEIDAEIDAGTEADAETGFREDPPWNAPASLPNFFQMQDEEEDNADRASDGEETGEMTPPVFEFDEPAEDAPDSATESDESDEGESDESESGAPTADEAFGDFFDDPGEATEKTPDSGDEAEDFAGEIKEMINEEEEESEVRSSGPFYF